MKTYPFIYLGSGTSYYDDTLECCIWFKNKLESKKLEKLFADLPAVHLFSHIFHEQAVYLKTNKDNEYAIKTLFDKDFKARVDKDDQTIWDDEDTFLPTPKEWKAFDDLMKQWLLKIHEQFPIAFVFQWAKLRKGYGEYDSWHQWSLEHFSEVVLPLLQNFYDQRFDQDFAVSIHGMLTSFFFEYLKTLKTKSPKGLEQKKQLLKFVELLCSHDGIYADKDIFINEYYINLVFAHAKIMLQLLKDFEDDQQREIIINLKPYTQLVLFVGAGDEKNKPLLFLFEKPHEYLRTLVKKIEPKRKDILSDYIRYIMMAIYTYWRDKKSEEEAKIALLDIVDLALSLPNCNLMTFTRAEIIYEKYGQPEELKNVRKRIKQANDGLKEALDDDELWSMLQ